MKNSVAERVIKEGEFWVKELKRIQSLDKLKVREKEILDYIDLIDENFGEENPNIGEQESSLSTSFVVAWNWKRDALKSGEPDTQKLFENFLQDFEKELYSKAWIK